MRPAGEGGFIRKDKYQVGMAEAYKQGDEDRKKFDMAGIKAMLRKRDEEKDG